MITEKKTLRVFLSRTIIFSILYNLVWFVIFFLLLYHFTLYPMWVVIGFLIVYLLIALPLKDFFFLRWYRNFIYGSRGKSAHIESRISSIHTIEDMKIFLGDFVKLWKLDSLRFVHYFPQPKILYISAKGKMRLIQIKKPDNPLLMQFLRKSLLPMAKESFPPEVQQELNERGVSTLAPVVYRQKLFGYLAFREPLKELDTKVISLITQRIGLTFENEFMRQKIPTYKAIEKEIDAAKKVERLLQLKSGEKIFQYLADYSEQVWEDKHFPALYDLHVPEMGKNKNGFVMLARLSNTSARSKILQLFITQGYFYSLAQTSASLEVLINSLHELLRDRENGKILLDGFLLEISPSSQIRMQSFGQKLSMAIDDDLFFVLPYSSLGSKGDFICKPQKISFEKQLDLNIQKYTLLQFKRVHK